MKTIKKHWLALAGLLGTAGLLMGIVLTTLAQSVPPPLFSISVTNATQLSITVTNGVSYADYTLYNQHVLGSPDWTFITNPPPGVSNFVVNMYPFFDGFYTIVGSTNWNNGGIANWAYADPKDPGLGVLTVTIVSPANGAVIQ
jgi:hypothetical protein